MADTIDTIRSILEVAVIIVSVSCIKDCIRLIMKLTDSKKGGKK